MKKFVSFRFLIIILFSVYIFVYPWSILLVAFDLVPAWGTWMGGLLLIIQGTMLGVWLVAHYGRRGLLGSLLILVFGWFVEHIGTTTGVPFGPYWYTDVLIPKVLGVVPLAIPFAWLLVVPSSLGIVEFLRQNRNTANDTPSQRNNSSNILLQALGAGTLAVLLDITIEPVSVHVSNYWVWSDTVSGFYGVPVSNFVAWWLTSVLLTWLLLAIRGPLRQYLSQPSSRTHKPPRIQWHPAGQTMLFPWLPPLLYILNLIMFVVVNIAHAQISPAVIGVVMLAYLVFKGKNYTFGIVSRNPNA